MSQPRRFGIFGGVSLGRTKDLWEDKDAKLGVTGRTERRVLGRDCGILSWLLYSVAFSAWTSYLHELLFIMSLFLLVHIMYFALLCVRT